MRRKMGAVLVGTLAVAVAATGCQKNTGGGGGGGNPPSINNSFQVDNNAKGPAPEIPGAVRGGTATIVGSADFDRALPWADYRGDGIMVTSQLIARTLTNYYEEVQPDGKIITKLMGDMATNTGVTTDCKTYTFTLRDGMKYADGEAVKAKDIAYGISIAFADEATDGPTYIQKWLAGNEDYQSVYKGPYKEAGKLAPNLETPDDKTITFKFASPHCDFPQAAALLTTVAQRQSKDTGVAKLETGFDQNGPYKVKSWTRGEKMVLERNPNWDPNSDPLRHNYPDGYVFDWKAGSDPVLTTKRFVTDAGPDQASIQWDNVPSEAMNEALGVPKERQLDGDTVFVQYLYINNQRVKDVDVRRALYYAYNRTALKQIIGGDKAGTFPATTITSPVTPGYKKFDAYPDAGMGNPDKAKQLLQGKTVPPLKYCYRPGTPIREQSAAAAKENLEKGGFQITLFPIDPTTYYPTVGRKDTDCDLIVGGWGMDYPSSSTVMGVLMKGGAAITPTGNNNLSYFDDPATNAELDRLAGEADITKAAEAYGNLDEKVMKDFCPLIPLYYDHSFSLLGSKVGGLYLSGNWGSPSLQNVYVKS